MTDGVCEHAIDIAIRMQIGCEFGWGCVHTAFVCVTLVEVNKSGVTVTEECLVMIPPSAWVCICTQTT